MDSLMVTFFLPHAPPPKYHSQKKYRENNTEAHTYIHLKRHKTSFPTFSNMLEVFISHAKFWGGAARGRAGRSLPVLLR